MPMCHSKSNNVAKNNDAVATNNSNKKAITGTITMPQQIFVATKNCCGHQKQCHSNLNKPCQCHDKKRSCGHQNQACQCGHQNQACQHCGHQNQACQGCNTKKSLTDVLATKKNLADAMTTKNNATAKKHANATATKPSTPMPQQPNQA